MRRSPLKSVGKVGRERRRQSSMSRLQRELFRKNLGPCAMGPDGCDGHVDAHHVITREALRKHGQLLHEWDRANRMPLCRAHHAAHHNCSQPVPRDLLPESVFDFADEVGLGWWLDRHYGAERKAA